MTDDDHRYPSNNDAMQVGETPSVPPMVAIGCASLLGASLLMALGIAIVSGWNQEPTGEIAPVAGEATEDTGSDPTIAPPDPEPTSPLPAARSFRSPRADGASCESLRPLGSLEDGGTRLCFRRKSQARAWWTACTPERTSEPEPRGPMLHRSHCVRHDGS